MTPIYVRPLRTNDPEDRDEFVRRADASDRFFPRNVFTLPSTEVMVAEKMVEGKPEIILYQPMYVSLVMGSFLAGDKGTQVDLAHAQKMLTAHAYTRAHAQGMADVMFLSNTPETLQFAMQHGFERAHVSCRLEVR